MDSNMIDRNAHRRLNYAVTKNASNSCHQACSQLQRSNKLGMFPCVFFLRDWTSFVQVLAFSTSLSGFTNVFLIHPCCIMLEYIYPYKCMSPKAQQTLILTRMIGVVCTRSHHAYAYLIPNPPCFSVHFRSSHGNFPVSPLLSLLFQMHQRRCWLHPPM